MDDKTVFYNEESVKIANLNRRTGVLQDAEQHVTILKPKN